MDFTRVRTRLPIGIRGVPLMRANTEYSINQLRDAFMGALDRTKVVEKLDDGTFRALVGYGVRGEEVLRAGSVYEAEEILQRYFNILERFKLVMGVPGYTLGEALHEDVPEGEEKEEALLEPKDDPEDPRSNPKTKSYPVLEGQMDLTVYETKAWRKYLRGKSLDGLTSQAVTRARIKMGLDEDSGGSEDE